MLLLLQTQKANFVPAKTSPVPCHSPSVWEWHSHFLSFCSSFHSNNTGTDHPFGFDLLNLTKAETVKGNSRGKHRAAPHTE